MPTNGPARVLDVGQCAPDHYGIRDLIEQDFDARVDSADSIGEALNLMRRERYDLVLINRVLFNDGADGLELVRIAKREELSTPIMMVSNYPEAQSEAVAAGAVPGFGKANLRSAQTREHLMKFLPVRNVQAT
jgi:CheY-like chemotaxis protein